MDVPNSLSQNQTCDEVLGAKKLKFHSYSFETVVTVSRYLKLFPEEPDALKLARSL